MFCIGVDMMRWSTLLDERTPSVEDGLAQYALMGFVAVCPTCSSARRTDTRAARS